jgi:hypothetical protein
LLHLNVDLRINALKLVSELREPLLEGSLLFVQHVGLIEWDTDISILRDLLLKQLHLLICFLNSCNDCLSQIEVVIFSADLRFVLL